MEKKLALSLFRQKKREWATDPKVGSSSSGVYKEKGCD